MDEQVMTAEPEQQTEATTEIQPEEAVITSDGELEFGDEFFGESGDTGTSESDDTGDSEGDTPKEAKPSYYTEAELRDTPFEKWETARLSPDARTAYEAAIAQRNAAQAQYEAQQNRAQLEQRLSSEAPQKLTHSDAANMAMKAAKSALKLNDDDELDMYDPEHLAAYNMAMRDVFAGEQARYADYQSRAQFSRFSNELRSQPDYAKFDEYMKGEFEKRGITPQILSDYVARTGDRASVQQYLTQSYAQFRQSQQTARTAVKAPPIVESSGGHINAGRRVDVKKLGEMDDEEQAEALIALGFV